MRDDAPRAPLCLLPPAQQQIALARFYYDTAQPAHPMAMGSLLKVAAPTQVMFGTDFPFGSAANHLKGLAELGYSPEVLAGIHRTNATRLMPQFA